MKPFIGMPPGSDGKGISVMESFTMNQGRVVTTAGCLIGSRTICKREGKYQLMMV
jgi:hypothetical protein